MANYPHLKFHVCSENVVNVDFVDINFTSADLFNIPTITVVTDTNVNAFVSDVTLTTARINFSAKYTGTVKYSVISNK